MNVIDRTLQALRMSKLTVRYERAKLQIYVERSQGLPDIEAEGQSLEEAVRHALENMRIGYTTCTRDKPGDRIYNVTIVQTRLDAADHECFATAKRVIAKTDEAARALAMSAFSDRPGFVGVEVTYHSTI